MRPAPSSVFHPLPALLLALLSVAATTLAADPPRKVEPVATWNGSLDDTTKAPKGTLVVIDNQHFAKLWTDLELKGDPPKIDFKNHCAVLDTTSGSHIHMMARLNDKGDLTVMSMATQDMHPGFRFVLAQFNTDGIKSVNGKPLAAPKPTLTGTITCKAAGEIPAGAIATIALHDVSLADAPAKTLAQQIIEGPATFPLPFALTFDPASLRLQHTHFYSLGIRIEKDGKLLFINDTHIAISKNDQLLPTIDAPVIPISPR